MKRLIGLDLGSKTVGVAISDPMGMLARTLMTVRFPQYDFETACKQVIELCKQNEVDEVVLGLPRHMNGDIGESGQMALDFKEMLLESGLQTVTMWDERLTTVAAQRLLISADVSRKKRKEVIDQVAAVGILQSYLDRK
ncbi:MAG: Holliday junction resolvase RuvX [Firmicutes bacterium HGW-Firmicutes-19]|jgi:putative holliday junction resolvase|nr:MAG: Holliday junction resolvase RuvX [Firmicutes bacterium HGW-Firmicutes-19]